mmetsp:Transcript_32072/g.63585  ORF Transcript_32072/g.63585 Transcript_32072/m.63585 type:complete len:128 (-) Transcript_32072:21-404(-)
MQDEMRRTAMQIDRSIDRRIKALQSFHADLPPHCAHMNASCCNDRRTQNTHAHPPLGPLSGLPRVTSCLPRLTVSLELLSLSHTSTGSTFWLLSFLPCFLSIALHFLSSNFFPHASHAWRQTDMQPA